MWLITDVIMLMYKKSCGVKLRVSSVITNVLIYLYYQTKNDNSNNIVLMLLLV